MSKFHRTKTHCLNGHELTQDNIKKLSNNSGHRVCKICHRINAKRQRDKYPKNQRKTKIERFWAKVNKTTTCWLWTAAMTGGNDGKSYGFFDLTYAHRFSYELMYGTIPNKLTVDHLCRNKACVNPHHLEAVPQRINVLRGIGTPSINAKKTHCKRGHPFTPNNTYICKTGARQCMICKRLLNDLHCGEVKARAAAQALGK